MSTRDKSGKISEMSMSLDSDSISISASQSHSSESSESILIEDSKRNTFKLELEENILLKRTETETEITDKVNVDVRDEESIIDILKKSLKLTENEFLDSEIEDLKEFFNVEIVEDRENSYDYFWVSVVLPVTLRRITEEGKEIIENEKPLVSIKIKLNNKKNTVKSKLEVNENKIVNKALKNENDDNSIKDDDNDDIKSEETKEIEIDNEIDNLNELLLPYEVVDFKISFDSELKFEFEIKTEIVNETEEIKLKKLRSILSELIQHPSTSTSLSSLSLLTIIEEFYIKLEEINYPFKEIIKRDYYYPVFDCRHWCRYIVRSKFRSDDNNNDNHDDNNEIYNNHNNNVSTLNLSLSYRARALYDFQALMQGELSFKEDEILMVLANLGNGWLTARHVSASTNPDDSTGLIPENYIERL